MSALGHLLASQSQFAGHRLTQAVPLLRRGGLLASYRRTHNGSDGKPNRVAASREELRNIGIVAHINAGKTTTTERILYLAGSTDTVGDVDKGTTVTDYLSQERERGITITSAAVSYHWKKHRVNLIDTPGHVDFTIEVERSLSVLDGAVTLLDASAGVEAQTLTVWNQATRYRLPNIVFLNKCDKPQANFEMCLDDIESTLGIRAVPIQLPVLDPSGPDSKGLSNFRSIIDLVNMRLLTWVDAESKRGAKYTNESLSKIATDQLAGRHLEAATAHRERLVNVLADADDQLANHVIECDSLSDVKSEILSEALRRATLSCRLSPVLVGSSFKYVGVQELMNAIVKYLPSPDDRLAQLNQALAGNDDSPSASRPLPSHKDPACTFIFKITHDKHVGPLGYLRVYSGQLARNQRLVNLETGAVNNIKSIHRAFADELRELDQKVERNDIVVASGLADSRTGDILVDEKLVGAARDDDDMRQSDAKTNTDLEVSGTLAEISSTTSVPFRKLGGNDHILIPKIDRMEPVYFCTIEAHRGAQQEALEKALACLAREDPSFTYEVDQVGTITIRGMGKLHLEVMRDRLASEYKIEALLGRLQISYRETIYGSAEESLEVSRVINGANNSLNMALRVTRKPNAGHWSPKLHFRLDTRPDSEITYLRHDHQKALEQGFAGTLSHGPQLGHPIVDCSIMLTRFHVNSRCTAPFIASAAGQCLSKALEKAGLGLLEPQMLLEVSIPAGTHISSQVLGDLAARRGHVISTTGHINQTTDEVTGKANRQQLMVRARVPLSELADYSEFLRVTSSGRASFAMRLVGYTPMSPHDAQRLVAQGL